MSETPPLRPNDPIPTRYSLLSRLQDWGDQESWRTFFDTYWRLIYATAIKSGLSEAEAEDVVQETVISVAKDIHKFRRDRARGSFKGWLKNLTRWRIADQLRKRPLAGRPQKSHGTEPEEEAAALEDIPDPSPGLDALWEEEWRANLLALAAERVKRQVKEEQFQMFHLYAVKNWPARKVARRLGVSVGQVYLAKHRIGALIKKEVRKLEE
jgi:RNA polymerase sigma factor (sigma-70 family)